MSPEPTRHRAPALWLVIVAIVLALLLAVLVDTDAGVLLLIVTLLGVAAARITYGGRQPEGLAVRAVWVDVLVLGALAIGLALLLS